MFSLSSKLTTIVGSNFSFEGKLSLGRGCSLVVLRVVGCLVRMIVSNFKAASLYLDLAVIDICCHEHRDGGNFFIGQR